MTRRMVIMILALTLLFGAVFGWKAIGNYFMRRHFATFEPPPERVESAVVALTRWPERLEAVGTLRAAAGIEVSSEVAGVVQRIAFDSGQRVAQGALLVDLEATVDEARLTGLVAAAELAAAELRRQEAIARQKLAAAAELDTARSALRQAEAAVSEQRELIARKAIRAPFAGELGIRRVDPGQYVSPGQALVTLVNLDPIHADFSLPEQALARVRSDQPVAVRVAAFGDQPFEGRITAIEPRVEETTRNVRLRATLRNPEGRLRPGMFAALSVQLPEAPEYPTIPRTALSTSLYGDFVYVVERTMAAGETRLKAVQRFVKSGPVRGGEQAIVEGLAAGEQVVAAGQFKLQNGSAITLESSGPAR